MRVSAPFPRISSCFIRVISHYFIKTIVVLSYHLFTVLLIMVFLLQGGRLLIRLGDSDIDYDKNFKYVFPSYYCYLGDLSCRVLWWLLN